MNIFKARIFNACLLNPIFDDSEAVTKSLPALLEDGVPRLDHILAVGSSIVAVVAGVKLARLDVAAGLAASVRLAEHRGPILESPVEEAHVDEVEGVWLPSPGLTGVVNLELDVWRYPGRLIR